MDVGAIRTSGGTLQGLSLNFVTWIGDDGWPPQACRIMITIWCGVRYKVRNSPNFSVAFYQNAVGGVYQKSAALANLPVLKKFLFF
jgi:hypothetical protein